MMGWRGASRYYDPKFEKAFFPGSGRGKVGARKKWVCGT